MHIQIHTHIHIGKSYVDIKCTEAAWDALDVNKDPSSEHLEV